MKRILSIAALLLIATASMANAPKPELQEQGGKVTCVPVSVVCRVNGENKTVLSADACGKNMQELMENVQEIAQLVRCEGGEE